MAAEDKSELLSITSKEYAKLEKLIGPIDAKDAVKTTDGVSIKDVIGHRAHWIDLFLGWYSDGLAGKVVHFPAKGYKWNDLKRYNEDLRQQQADLNWDQARSILQDKNTQLAAFLESMSETDLYGGPMRGANNKWTTGRWAEAAGASHYRSASKFVRSALRARSES